MSSPLCPPWAAEDQAAAKRLFKTNGIVKPEWIDYNGHMNVAYYVLAFDLGDDLGMYQHLGLSEKFRQATNMTTMTAEAHVRYLNEVVEGEAYRIYSQILDFDSKRWHEIQYMVRGREDSDDDDFALDPGAVAKQDLIATHEVMALSVDLSVRRVRPWHSKTLDRLQATWQEHAKVAVPEWLGQSIAIPAEKSLARRG